MQVEVDRLRAEADGLQAEADRLRAEAERVRRIGDRMSLGLWTVAAMALVFTMANVTKFATSHDTPWWIGWLLDPMVSLALLVVLIGDGVLSRHGIRAGGWARVLKWGSACGTWAMNVWVSVQAQDAAGIVLHSLPPALVIGLSEATPGYRAKFAALAAGLQAKATRLHTQAAQLRAGADHLHTRADVQADVQADATADVRTAERRTQEPTTAPDCADRTPVRASTRESARESARGSVERSVRTSSPGSGRTLGGESESGGGSGRRTEEELLALVRSAIADGTLPLAPSGTAIHRVLGGGKGPALRVAQRLASPAAGPASADGPADGDAGDGTGDGPGAGGAGGPVIHLVHERAEVAS